MIKTILLGVFGITTAVSAVVAVDNWDLWQNRHECKLFLKQHKRHNHKVDSIYKALNIPNDKRLPEPCNKTLQYAINYKTYANQQTVAAKEPCVFTIPNDELAGLLYGRDIHSQTYIVLGKEDSDNDQYYSNCVILFPKMSNADIRDTTYTAGTHETFPVIKKIGHLADTSYPYMFKCPQ